MRKIAIVGAGFAGLAVCYHLLENFPCEVTLFDPAGIGGGASSVSTGLLHPFPGRLALRSWLSAEGMQATNELLNVSEKALGKSVALRTGAYRIAVIPAQVKAFAARARDNPEAIWIDNVRELIPQAIDASGLWIPSGVTVFSKLYLEGLGNACLAKGAILERKSIHSLKDLEGYDATVLCTGAGTMQFPECEGLRLEPIKGQTLLCKWAEPIPCSLIGLGHISPTEDPALCQVGSTYERDYASLAPTAKSTSNLLELVGAFYPSAKGFEVVAEKTGVRMTVRNEYRPIVQQIAPKAWVFTALGSRGLLYHAVLGRQLALAVKNSVISTMR